MLTGAGDLSGQTPFMLGGFAHRIYVPAPETEDAYAPGITVLKEAGFEEKNPAYLAPGDNAAATEGNALVKPWESPAPSLTPPPSLPSASPEPTAEPSPAPTPTAEPEDTPTPLSIP